MSSSRTETSSVQVVMPQMGVSVAEGTIIEWTKRPGDWVERDETVLPGDHRQDRRRDPLPSVRAAERILIEPGDTVDVGTPLAELDADARPGEAHPEEHREEQPPAEGGKECETDRSGFHSPVVRRMAEEHGIDLSSVRAPGSAVASASGTSSR